MAQRWDRDPGASGPVVGGFSGGGFVVDGGVYLGLLLTPLRADPWTAPPLPELGIDALDPLLALQPAPEFIILGTGERMHFPPKALRESLAERGVGIEAMDSRAAARLWGLLRSEGRWIAAALMPL